MTESSLTEFLSLHSPFDQLEPETIEFLSERLQLQEIPQGQRLAGPDTGCPGYLYILARGQVRVAENGDSGGANWILEEGECFPIGALSGNRPTTNIYEAASEIVCYALAAEDFQGLLEVSKIFSHYCSNYLSKLLSESRRNLRTRFTQFASDQQSLSAELHQMIKRPPCSVTADTSLEQAFELMNEKKVGSIVVVDDARIPVGILTQSDILKRVVLAKVALSKPISNVMSINPTTLSENARVYDAVFAMAARGVRHVLLVDGAGQLTGVISERDLFALQKIGIGYIRQTIESAPDVGALTLAIKDIHHFAMNMLAQGVGADQITRFISALNDAVTIRIIAISLQTHDLSDIEWCWLAFGSEGREEQTLSTDQDNGIVFLCPPGLAVPAAKERLVAFARQVNADLDRCGYPLCEGNVMAGNPEWCLTLAEWKDRFTHWLLKPEPMALLNASIFFDFRAIHGETSLADDMHKHLFGMSKASTAFQRMLAFNALCAAPPLGMFRDFVTESVNGGEPYIDLKKFGARLFVDAARVFALAHSIDTANTVQRLRRAAAATASNQVDNEALVEAFNFIQLLRLRHQYQEIGQGRPGDNRFPPARLNQLDRRILKEAFRQAKRLQQRLNLTYQLSLF
jgi:CBS domain-containing protein